MSSADHCHRSVANADPNLTTGAAPDATAVTVRPAVTERYTLGDEIARGGMGIIHRAIDTVLGREVAVKVLHEKYTPESGAALRFAGEARITSQLQHPSIPPVHDLGTLTDGRPFLAMKLIKGQTLEELLQARPDPSAERGRFVAVFEHICQALAYAHSRNVLHRDLKPANVMVGAFGEVAIFRRHLASTCNNIGWLHAHQKRYADALLALDQGIALCQKLTHDHPTNAYFAHGLGYSHAYRGWTRAHAGQPAEAAADLRQAVELWAKNKALDIETRFERSRALALLAGLGADAKSGVTTDDAKTFADQAVAALADAVKSGWAVPRELKEPDFDTLRGRADFQKLVSAVQAKAEKPADAAPMPKVKK
jgi:tetratricopeptide (TPR) repeat protein